jgi:hypothetical protein
MIKLKELYERFEFRSTLINGKRVDSSFQGTTNNMNEFIKQIKNLPETLESIKIPTETLAFNPDQEEFKGPITTSHKARIIKIVKDLTREFKEKGDPVTEYEISSYYGVNRREREVTDPIYISFRTKGHDKFASDMGSGKHGPLD